MLNVVINLIDDVQIACYMIEPKTLHVLHIYLFIYIYISLNENIYHVENSIISKENTLDAILKAF